MASSLHDTEEIVRRALSADLIGPSKRRLLLDGLPMGFVYSLPTVSRPIDQLRFDLMELSRTPRLIGLSEPPLAIWLRNAARLAAPRPESGFFDEKASALDGKPKRYGGGSESAAPARVSHSNVVDSVAQGSVGVNHGNVTINHTTVSHPPQDAATTPGSQQAPRNLIVITLGVSARAAEEAARKQGYHPIAVHPIEVPPGTHQRPPTDGDWRVLRSQIESTIAKTGAATEGDLGLFASERTPTPMLAWVAWCVVHRMQGAREVHVFDGGQFAVGQRWRPLGEAGEQLELRVEEVEGELTAEADDLIVHVDLGAPRVNRHLPRITGASTRRITLDDRTWRRGGRTASAVREPLADALDDLHEACGATTRWHVFYDGPSTLWYQMARWLVLGHRNATLYSTDGKLREHAALDLLPGTWLDEREFVPSSQVAYDAFIAYPSKARAIATQLYERLTGDYRVFMDAEGLLPGDAWDEVLPAAQANSRVTLLVLTPDSKDAWFQREEILAGIELARKEGRSHRVVPILAKGLRRDELLYGLNRLHAAEWPSDSDPREVMEQLRAVLDRAREKAEDPPTDPEP